MAGPWPDEPLVEKKGCRPRFGSLRQGSLRRQHIVRFLARNTSAIHVRSFGPTVQRSLSIWSGSPSLLLKAVCDLFWMPDRNIRPGPMPPRRIAPLCRYISSSAVPPAERLLPARAPLPAFLTDTIPSQRRRRLVFYAIRFERERAILSYRCGLFG